MGVARDRCHNLVRFAGSAKLLATWVSDQLAKLPFAIIDAAPLPERSTLSPAQKNAAAPITV
jgi:hypothetical protein